MRTATGSAAQGETEEYLERMIHAVRRRPRSLGMPFSLWTLQRLADYMAESTGIRVTYETVRVHLEDDEVEAVLRGAAGRVVLLYLPTYSPWLNPIEMLWRHFRREVTHCELFENVKVLVAAAYDFFERYNRCPWRVLSIIGSDPAEIT